VDEAADHADVAELASADEVAAADVVRRDAAVRADLHDAAGGARGIHHRAAFHHGVTDRFLDVDVRTGFHGGNHRECVPVIGRADDRDLGLRLREQRAVVLIQLWRGARAAGAVFQREIELTGVDIAECDELARAAGHRLAQDVVAPPAAADERGAEFLRAGLVCGADRERERGERAGGGGALQEMAAIHGRKEKGNR